MSRNQYYLKSEHVSCRISDKGKGFLFDHESGYVYLLNKTGCYILTLLQQGAAYDELISNIKIKFIVNGAAIGEDVQHFLAELERMGLVVKRD
jgi:PqqD family protein of HPr-rel-A system